MHACACDSHVTVGDDVAVPNNVVTAAEPLKQPPDQLAVRQASDAADGLFRSAPLRCAAPAAVLVVTASSFMFVPSVLTPFGYSALVLAVSPYP